MKKRDLLIEIEKLQSKIGAVERRLFVLENPTDKQVVTPKEIFFNPKFLTNPPPLIYENLVCPRCGNDSGWANVLYETVPPEGFRCMSCGEACIYGRTLACRYETVTHPQVHTETKPAPCNVTCDKNGNILTNGTLFR